MIKTLTLKPIGYEQLANTLDAVSGNDRRLE